VRRYRAPVKKELPVHRSNQLLTAAAIAIAVVTGCAKPNPPSASAGPIPNVLLSQEPAGAVEVLDARDEAKDGEPIVLVGRLGGGLKPWIDGRAAFLLVDTRILPSCDEDGHQCEAGCPDCAKEMLAASTMVKFLGSDGKVLAVDARDLLKAKEESTVVVRGIASRDPTGNLSIAAEGVFVRR
jgi:hypothetical protein